MAAFLRIGHHLINATHIVEASYAERSRGEGPDFMVWFTQTSPKSPSTRTLTGEEAEALWAWICRESVDVVAQGEGM
jgi:hypothetical protein